MSKGKSKEMSNRRASNLAILLFLAVAGKLVALILSSVICGLLSGVPPDTNVGIIIACCVLTILYITFSTLISAGILCRCTQWIFISDIIEAIGCILYLGFWLACCGIAANVSLQTDEVWTSQFAWIGACSGLSAGVFLALVGLFCVRTATYFIYKA